MDLSIVILAGGRAKRLGVDKALIFIKDKSLIAHTLEKVLSISEDILVITKTEKRLKKLKHAANYPVKFLLDEDPSIESPLIGALTGFKNAEFGHVLLLGCDMPLIKPRVIELLYEYYSNVRPLCWAVIPEFPNGYIEPLCAIYSKEPAIKAIQQSIQEKSYRLRSFIDRISAAHFFPVTEIKPIDPELHTFFNVNTRYDLEILIKILEVSESE
ncbi:MAG: molybdenum cofactor guanylyltransferase [Candidatus Helarchaeota archaeon]|nr:molybdenum cofactor guanylyltransferase [Candidatus Helarchaeota archaeon]